ncbi:AI-2E family transporter [Rhodopila sp.]|uniref:AI-2E family transporter n=1 Tax=Rhodopila sp. TaxID=2480087 RepID=UPI002CA417E2|nr:AI-2E family transporter [Rhodopila sp.]HVZ08857.1 AI-2E family transporter [Rhodopila sp.]
MPNDLLGLNSRPNMNIPAAETPRPGALLSLATGVVIVAALYLAREILIPITLSIFLSFFLAPLVRLLQRARLPKVVAAIASVVAALAVVLLIGMLIGSQLATLVGNLPQYQATALQKYETIRGTVTDAVHGLTRHLGTTPGHPLPTAESLTGVRPAREPMPVVIESTPTTYLEAGREFLAPILSPLGTLAIVLVVTIFILTQQEDLRDRLIRLFGSNDLHRTTLAIDDAVHRLTRYFMTQAAINGSFGLFIGFGLFFIGLPSPVLWGVLAALLRFVPYIGAVSSAFFPVALAAVVYPGWSVMLWTASLFVVAELVTSQVLEPLLYGSSAGLSPTAVVLVAIFWSWIWGPIGLILSTPLTLCLVVLGRHVRHLEFFDVLLGDRPALTPTETFYQRLLAGDPDEVVQQAESLLHARSLSAYYDDVAFPALQLLARDVSRRAILPAQLAKIRDDIDSVIEDLDMHDDVTPDTSKARTHGSAVEVSGVPRGDARPSAIFEITNDHGEPVGPAWQAEGSVLCVAGRGPLDDTAAEILRQLLRKRGFGARAVPHQEVSRASIDRIDPAGVGLICITYLEIADNPPHMRYLIRRARQRFPDRPILVGFWSPDDPFLRDPSAKEMAGSAIFVGSLRDAVNECLAIAHKPGQGVAA